MAAKINGTQLPGNVLLKLNLLWFFDVFCYWKSTPHLSVFLSGHLWPPKTRHPTNLNESVYMEKPVWQGDTSSDPKLSQHHPSPFGLWFQMGWNNSSQIGSVRQVGVKIDKKIEATTHLHFCVKMPPTIISMPAFLVEVSEILALTMTVSTCRP